MDVDELVARIQEAAKQRSQRGERFILGITGAPGGGKSTLAQRLLLELTARDIATALVPMDGFHLADVELERLGRISRKGAIDTFDADGYVALLRRLRNEWDRIVYAPSFARDLEEPIAGAIAVLPQDDVIITEGNYLLSPTRPWPAVSELLDEVWFCELDDEERRQRLVDRHVRFGKDPQAARGWVETVDQPNADLISQWKNRADYVVAVE